jgi:two-component system, OmpR family, sensor kinase
MTYPPSSDAGGFWRAVRGLPGRTPLRVKLITAVLALVAVALTIISVTGISVLRDYLLQQYDTQLVQARTSGAATGYVQRFLSSPAPEARPEDQVTVEWLPTGGSLQQVLAPVAGGVTDQSEPHAIAGPQVQRHASWLTADAGRQVTVPATSGGGMWRVIAFPQGFQGPTPGQSITGTVIVGVDVTSVYGTVRKLANIDLIVSAIVLLGLAVVGIALVRASLRPLTDIERTAEGIAAGDLTRRVPQRDPRTEVGRLGRSLNAMLAQIETAFRARADSEAAARKSEERMRQFVADASHELRTPLTAIRGFAEYYRQRGGLDLTPNGQAPGGQPPGGQSPGGQAAVGGGSLPPADLDRIMRRVEQESIRMGVLVEDMLLLARLDQQRPLDYRTVDLLTLAGDAVHDARMVAPERSISLTVSSGAALLVIGDEVRLRQVIGNLMSNALVHTPDGTPIDVRLRSGSFDEGPPPGGASAGAAPTVPPRTAPGTLPRIAPGMPAQRSAAVLEVADLGPGLPPPQAERAFERFYRADQARTAGGTGLGLAIVAALVSAHGGRVWVESPPTGGAIFRIALPLAPEALGAVAEQDQQEQDQQERDQQEHGLDEHGPDEQPVPDILDSHREGSGRQPPTGQGR